MHRLNNELSQHAIGRYHDSVLVAPSLEVANQLAPLRAACELLLEPPDDVTTLMLCDRPEIDDGLSEDLVVGQRFQVAIVDRTKRPDVGRLHTKLRNGSIFIAHSFSFRSQTHMLIPAEEWPIKRNNLYGHLGLPQDPHVFLSPILEQLDQRLELLGQAVDEGKVRIDTAVYLDPLDAQPGDAEADRLRRAIFEAHPPGQLPEIILEIDSATRFSWILLGREPRSRIELLTVYSAVLAHGTSLSATDISRMVPEVSPAAIRQMMSMRRNWAEPSNRSCNG
ncbi:hypothetical protein OKW50_006895 [Paraburkholderia youngii]